MEYQDDEHTLSVPRGASDRKSQRPYRQSPPALDPEHDLESNETVNARSLGFWRPETFS